MNDAEDSMIQAFLQLSAEEKMQTKLFFEMKLFNYDWPDNEDERLYDFFANFVTFFYTFRHEFSITGKCSFRLFEICYGKKIILIL